MLTKKKKIIILCVMVALLVITGYLNVVLNNGVINTSGNQITSGNFFSTYRSDRESTRNQQILYYDAIVASASSSADAKTTAQTKKENLIDSMEMELTTEGLIKACGFEDVIIANSSEMINVIIKSAELTSSEVAKIVSIVKQQTNATIDNITIIPVE